MALQSLWAETKSGLGHFRRACRKNWPSIDRVLTLIISSVAALVLMAAIGILMAFMQYQVRLLSSLQNMTGGQLIQFVSAEQESLRVNKRIVSTIAKVKNIDYQIREKKLSVDYKIDGICSIFRVAPKESNPADSTKFDLCVDFMRSVPFDGTLGIARYASNIDISQSPIAVSAEDLSAKTDDEIIWIVLERLAKYTQSDNSLFNIEKFRSLIKSDILDVTNLNRELRTKLRAQYEISVIAYNSYCEEYNTLQGSIPYRRLSTQPCKFIKPNLYWSSVVASSNAKACAAPKVEATGGELGSVPAAAQNSTPDTQPRPSGADNQRSDQQRSFELVSHYMFYAAINALVSEKWNFMEKLILSPGDYIALWLVALCGTLGGFVNILFLNQRLGIDPTLKHVLIDPIQGMVCALIAYILLRSGFVAIADAERFKDISTISPFFLAFVGIAAGLIASKTIEVFRDRSMKWIGGVASDEGQWGIGLAEAAKAQDLDADTLASLIGHNKKDVQQWIDEKDVVPAAFQPSLAVALKTPRRKLFTPVPPPVKE